MEDPKYEGGFLSRKEQNIVDEKLVEDEELGNFFCEQISATVDAPRCSFTTVVGQGNTDLETCRDPRVPSCRRRGILSV